MSIIPTMLEMSVVGNGMEEGFRTSTTVNHHTTLLLNSNTRSYGFVMGREKSDQNANLSMYTAYGNDLAAWNYSSIRRHDNEWNPSKAWERNRERRRERERERDWEHQYLGRAFFDTLVVLRLHEWISLIYYLLSYQEIRFPQVGPSREVWVYLPGPSDTIINIHI